MKKGVVLLFRGMQWGCTVSTFVGLAGALFFPGAFRDLSSEEYVRQVLCAMVVGIGFFVPTLLYSSRRLAGWAKGTLHMGIGLSIYVVTGCFAGWIPLEYGPGLTAITLLGAFCFSIAVWAGFSLYYKHQAKLINEHIQLLKKDSKGGPSC